MEKLFEIFNTANTKEEFVTRMAKELKNDPKMELATIMMYYSSNKN